ncbi:MAG: DUF418 domain-containing protein [Planctomycetota bacterium]|nr:DUF418 domain-containing protein [Planctomycetota bacterium]
MADERDFDHAHADAGHGLTTPDQAPAGEAVKPAPVALAQRFDSLDILRGFALLGILAMNIQTFAMPFAAYQNPTVFWPFDGVNRLTFLYTHFIFDQKMMSLFSMLFGAGVVLYAAKAKTKSDIPRIRWLWLRRMFWLFVIGMIHAYLIWEGDILVTYALCGAILIWWIRRFPVWVLLPLSIVFLLIMSGLSASQGWWMQALENAQPGDFGMNAEELDEARGQMAEQAAWFNPGADEIDRLVRTYRGSYGEVFAERASVATMLQTFGFLFFLFWRASAMMMLGIVLMKTRVFTGERSSAFYAAMAMLGYVIGFPLIAMGVNVNLANNYEAAKVFMYGSHFNAFGSVFVALGHAGLLLFLYKSGVVGWLMKSLAAVGRMAFSNYLMQSVICAIIFYGYGFGYYGSLDRLEQQIVVVGIWIFQIVFSLFWLSRFRFGPMEWLWRALTYWKAPRMRLDR